MRHTKSLRFALLGIVAQSARGIHGYALKRQCERLLGSFWQVNFGEIYRVLDRLSAEGLIEHLSNDAPVTKKVFRITEKGRASLDDFVLAPPTDAPRPMRQELAVKLLFAGQERLPQLLDLIDHQREAYLRQLRILGQQRRKILRAGVDGFVTGLLLDGAELAARAELTWLDDVTQKLRERFA